MKSITVNVLNQKSIQKALGELIAYREKLKNLPDLILKAAAERLDEIIGEQAPAGMAGRWKPPEYDADSGGWVIVLDGVAEFFEFGTGIVGRNDHSGINDEWLDNLPPPYNDDWNSGPKIHRTPDDNYDDPDSYWIYKDDSGVHRTKGRPADPFLYRSVEQLKEEFAEIAKRVAKENGIGE